MITGRSGVLLKTVSICDQHHSQKQPYGLLAVTGIRPILMSISVAVMHEKSVITEQLVCTSNT